ncbi:COMM domain-containing protein 7-like [Nilaparvata lugens]|uniref:COMM domain-containing protein 7-like n=1 Tax=Nilaparvata lugens TaxID=108931 RepID=UPI00193D6C3A|nr:COMM domain-containing protein 7-like [Nilaparvata lugens]
MPEIVKDMDWQFGVTAACSNKEQVGKTFFYLKLNVESEDGSQRAVHMEMSLSQFYSFLHQLEKAKNSLDFLP